MGELRTKHFPVLLYDSTQIPEYFVQFVDAGLDLPNFSFTFLDKGFLMRKFGGRQLRLEDLSLALFDSAAVLGPTPMRSNLELTKAET